VREWTMMKGTSLVAMFLAGCMLWAGSSFAGSAKDAWVKLVGKKAASRPEMAFVQNDPALPNVLLYGDSISIGYTQQVRASLKGKANVYRLYCNGGDSASVIPKMDQMHSTMRDAKLEGHWSFEWDVIHFNVGLHDLKYIANGKLDTKNGKQVHTTEQYEKNLKLIIPYLKKLAPRAKLVFCTTTPVPEGGQGRVAGDALKYNKVALKVMAEHPEITINDLYAFTKPKQPKWWTKPGNVHFNAEGRKAQGEEVARVILEALKGKGAK
jgi:lysophospholipase L1-like esterase